jgi:hypothetical protein
MSLSLDDAQKAPRTKAKAKTNSRKPIRPWNQDELSAVNTKAQSNTELGPEESPLFWIDLEKSPSLGGLHKRLIKFENRCLKAVETPRRALRFLKEKKQNLLRAMGHIR